MRRLMLFGLIAMMALPALGAKRVTVLQLREKLTAGNAANRSDVDMARQIGDLELTERLTQETLDHFAAMHRVGPKTALALQLLSDLSAFLEPPRGELPATEPPDAASQQRMVQAARAYAVQTWSRMPNFFVTRVTNRFDDAPHVLAKGDWPMYLGLQPTGRTRRQVAFRDGKEVQDTGTAAGAQNAQQEVGLRSWGEFGPALTVVLGDTARSTLTFSHWEKTPSGLAAVFTYSVPREASHYQVSFGTHSQTVIGRTQFGYSGRERTVQQAASIPRETDYQTHIENPAYHGTIAVDPSTGAVMRLTIQAELHSSESMSLAETMVQYGPVTIGERPFICPVRSLAISEMDRRSAALALVGLGDPAEWEGAAPPSGKSTILLVNETQFAEYHRLGSTARILTGEAGTLAAPGTDAPAGNQPVVQGTPEPAVATAAPAAQPVEAPVDSNSAPSSPASAPLAAAAAPPAPPAEPAIPEVSMAPASALPDRPHDLPPSDGSEFSLKVTSRLVDVGLVAYDKKGHPVSDLKADELEIYDNGQKRDIRSFALAVAPAQTPVAPTPEPSASDSIF